MVNRSKSTTHAMATNNVCWYLIVLNRFMKHLIAIWLGVESFVGLANHSLDYENLVRHSEDIIALALLHLVRTAKSRGSLLHLLIRTWHNYGQSSWGTTPRQGQEWRTVAKKTFAASCHRKIHCRLKVNLQISGLRRAPESTTFTTRTIGIVTD